MRRPYEDYAYSDAARAECFWTLPAHDWPRAQGDLTTEVVVIGAGFTGLSAALHLAQEGVQVTVLEEQIPGWGASGRNGGFCCMGGAKASPEKLAKRFGEAAAREFYNAEKAAIDLVAELLDTHNIDADTHSDGEVLLAHRPRAVDALRADADIYTALGESAQMLSKPQLDERGMAGPEFHAGLHLKLGFALNPAKYAHGLALAAQMAGADIRAHSPATKIAPQNGGFIVTTPQGRVTAKKLILATNGYSSDDLPDWLHARFLPVQSNILVTRPLTEDECAEQGWTSDLMAYDSRHLLHYFRLLPDGRFLIGTRGNVTATAQGQARMRDTTRADLARMFPAWRDVETPHFWSGLVCLARNLTPYAGPVGSWDNAWAGLAYHGNGVAMGSWTGARLADMVLGRKSPPKVHQAPLARFPLGRARRLLLRGAYHLYRWQDGA
ncbi:FAD-binding oxidoreductase [Aliiroseovarius subalbicans]|uniref:NAD(P)/FAD-dependent oxidoreductase n=1 Tax=Aliiroseovarius subalbicans TaxID=2925840 RepID=UPI001F56C89C|nr:FAD-binding oxidoreductase [Aliiroseovarius subalbicans]MCI2399161.1 FAD-binding oxidoreductase [Aliiroseovarius subalbicans]